MAAEPEASTKKIITLSDLSSKLKVCISLGKIIIFFAILNCFFRNFCHGAADLKVATTSTRS
jgi:hypothetical protein